MADRGWAAAAADGEVGWCRELCGADSRHRGARAGLEAVEARNRVGRQDRMVSSGRVEGCAVKSLRWGWAASTAEQRATTCRVPHLHWGHDRLSADLCCSVSNELGSVSGAREMEPAQGERLPAVAVGKQSEVADLDEAGGQDMEQEAADELDRIELHDAAAVVVPGVPPAEAHLSVIEAEESSVGDGNPMRVAGQILQHMFGSSERRLGVDHPLSPTQGAKQRVKCAWC
jgi:hypothetical protein